MKGKKEEMEFEDVENFFSFLQGAKFPSITLKKDKVKLTPEEAFNIIYVLQEGVECLPDSIEMCSECKSLYDADTGGGHTENYVELALESLRDEGTITISDEDWNKIVKKCNEEFKCYCDCCLPSEEYFDELVMNKIKDLQK